MPLSPLADAALPDVSPVVSIVVPLFNEEDNVDPLHAAIVAAMDGTPHRFEMLFVDDGSRDDTLTRLALLAAKDARLRVVKLARNFGQTAATAAGFHVARGRILVTLDGDLQNDPADIPTLLREIDRGCDMVVGWRRNRQDRWLSRKLPSRIANWLLARVTGVTIRDTGCALKAFRADVIRALPLYSDMHRFLPALMSTTGARIAQVPVNHFPRRFGQSKYGLSRTFKVISDLLMLKTILMSVRHSSWIFQLPAAISAGLSIAAASFGMAGEGNGFVPLSIAIIFGEMACFLAFLGILSQLVFHTGDMSPRSLSAATKRVIEYPPAEVPAVDASYLGEADGSSSPRKREPIRR